MRVISKQFGRVLCVFVRWSKQFSSSSKRTRKKLFNPKNCFHLTYFTYNWRYIESKVLTLQHYSHWDIETPPFPPLLIIGDWKIWCDWMWKFLSLFAAAKKSCMEGYLIPSRRHSHFILIYTSFDRLTCIFWRKFEKNADKKKFTCGWVGWRKTCAEKLFYRSPFTTNYASIIQLIACWIIYCYVQDALEENNKVEGVRENFIHLSESFDV